MPELPEVETTRRGIAPWLVGNRIVRVEIRQPRLRWTVSPALAGNLTGHHIHAVGRRGKYLLIRTTGGTLLLHLGMSGSLRLVPADTLGGRHDHLDVVLDSGLLLRMNDPRRFGSVHWTDEDPERHPLLACLGPEPLGEVFSGTYLRERSRGRRIAIKPHLMNARVVVGVGNIYASEALFRAGIHPARAAGRISLSRFDLLAAAVRSVLQESIREGGTTLRDFHGSDGAPGYFARRLRVYDRAGDPCPACGTPITRRTLGQRSTYFCPRCQR